MLNRHESNKDVFNTLLYEHIAICNMILRLEKNNLNDTDLDNISFFI